MWFCNSGYVSFWWKNLFWCFVVQSALHHAIDFGKRDVLETLLMNGADINQKDVREMIQYFSEKLEFVFYSIFFFILFLWRYEMNPYSFFWLNNFPLLKSTLWLIWMEMLSKEKCMILFLHFFFEKWLTVYNIHENISGSREIIWTLQVFSEISSFLNSKDFFAC